MPTDTPRKVRREKLRQIVEELNAANKAAGRSNLEAAVLGDRIIIKRKPVKTD